MHRVVGFICVLIGLILILWILKVRREGGRGGKS